MNKQLVSVVVLLVLLGVAAADLCQDAYDACDFRLGFTSGLQTYTLGRGTRRPFTQRIRSKAFGKLIGNVNANAKQPEFIFDTSAFPVSYFGTPYYSRTMFKPLHVRGTDGSGIGHERLVGNQFEFARYRCVRVFFSSYQVLNVDGNVKRVVHDNPPKDNKCVVFRTI